MSGNESGFKIQRLSNSVWTQVGTTAANVTSWANGALSASTIYTYRVMAYNTAGDSPVSNQASATTQASSPTPTPTPTPIPIPTPTPTPTGAWSKVMGSTGDDRLNAMVVDGSGNLITTGYYTGVVDFAGGGGDTSSIHASLTYLGNYTKDIFVAKYDSAGRHLWSRSFGNDGNSEMGQAVAVDGSGNIYLVGKTALGVTVRTLDFGCTNSDYQGAALNAFVVKLNGQGQCQWVRYVSDDYDDVATGVVVDGSGNVYMTGYFESSVNFDGQQFGGTTFTRIATGTLNGSGPSQYDGYLVKYNTNGVTQWVRRFGGSSSDQGNSVALDSVDSGIVVTGTFYSSANFDDSDGLSKFPITSAGDRDGLVVKYSSSGQLVWAIPVGTVGLDTLSDAAVDSGGNIWVTGLLSGQIYIAKYQGSNRQLAWPAKFFSAGSVGSGNSITLDSSGTATIGGYISTTVDFGGGALTPQQADTFAVQYSTGGAYVAGSSKLYGGGGYQLGILAISASGARTLGGYFPDFATLGSNSYTSAGSNDMFIYKP
jgi:Beta-propeller repeat